VTPDERALLLLLAKALSGNLPLPDFWRSKITTLALAVERAGTMTSASK
jgi:hypothetical protein